MSANAQRLVKNASYLVGVAVALYMLYRYDYLLYHSTLEVFSMVVAGAVLIVSWNGRRLLDNDYLLLVGFAYLSFLLLDIAHMLSLPEFGTLAVFAPLLATQLYVAQRGVLAVSFLVAPYFLTHRVRLYVALSFYLAVTAAVFAFFLAPGAGRGLDLGAGTPLRLIADGLAVVAFAASLVAVRVNRRHFDPDVMWLLMATVLAFAVSQVGFALSENGPEWLRLVADYTQALALFLTYKAVVEMAFIRPGALLYKDLADSERSHRITSMQYQHVADVLQTSLMEVPERLEGVAVASRYRSSSDVARVGGDFYDVFEVDTRRVAFVLGDVSGKGLEAAKLTAEVKSTVRAYSYLRPDPSFVLGKTNDALYRLLGEAQFVTALFGVLDTVSGEVEVASAGHEEPILCVEESCRFVEAPVNLPLGVGFGIEFRTAKLRLHLGDGLLAYTDGIPDASRGAERFGRERLEGLVRGRRYSSPEVLADEILDAVLSFSGGRLADDVAVLGIQLTRPDPESAAREEAVASAPQHAAV